jgi:nitrilase
MISGSDLHSNLESASVLIHQAANAGAKLVVLPEMFALFRTSAQLELGLDEAFGSAQVTKFLAQQAKKYEVWLVGGTVPIADKENSQRVRARCMVFDNTGTQVAGYDKIHLFDVDVADQQGSYRESDTFQAGNEVVTLETPFGRLGLAVCYDLRFPELFRAMFIKGVDIVAVPSAFTQLTGNAHWLPLLRARAIENQCYMIGANQGGQHSKSRVTSGGSVIIDGWGNVLAEAAMGEACITAKIDLKALSEQRKAIPVRDHLRFDIVTTKN